MDTLFAQHKISPIGSKNRIAEIHLNKQSPTSPLENLQGGNPYKIADGCNLTVGDEIRCFRPAHGIIPDYHHYGTYLGHGRVVAYDRAGLPLTNGKARIIFQSIAEFTSGSEPIEMATDPPAFSRDVVCARALANYGRVGRYNVFIENCSDLSDFAYFGRAMHTEQSNRGAGSYAASGVKKVIATVRRKNDWFAPSKEDQLFNFLGEWVVNASSEELASIEKFLDNNFPNGVCPGSPTRLAHHDHTSFHSNAKIPDSWGVVEAPTPLIADTEEDTLSKSTESATETPKSRSTDRDTNNTKETPSKARKVANDVGEGVAGVAGAGLLAWGFGKYASEKASAFYEVLPECAQNGLLRFGDKALERAGDSAPKVGKVSGRVTKGAVIVSGVIATVKIGYAINQYSYEEISGRECGRKVSGAVGAGVGGVAGAACGGTVGAFAGTMVFPGAGTIVGGIGGGIVGGYVGDVIGDKIATDTFDYFVQEK